MDPYPVLRNISAELEKREYIEIAEKIHSIKMCTFASYVMLFYDLLITLSDEVELIWSSFRSERRPQLALSMVLWIVNRYLWPLAYIVVAVSFNDPDWSTDTCKRYALYPQCIRLVSVIVVDIYFIIRLYAICPHNRWVLAGSIMCLCGVIAIKIWAFLDGMPLALPPGLVGCFLVPEHSPYVCLSSDDLKVCIEREADVREASQDRFLYTYVSEVVFDAAIFLTTIICILKFSAVGSADIMADIFSFGSANGSCSILIALAREECTYFALITFVNVLNVFLYRFAPIYEKNMLTGLSTVLSSLITSRLMLHLRRQFHWRPETPSLPTVSFLKSCASKSTFCEGCLRDAETS